MFIQVRGLLLSCGEGRNAINTVLRRFRRRHSCTPRGECSSLTFPGCFVCTCRHPACCALVHCTLCIPSNRNRSLHTIHAAWAGLEYRQRQRWGLAGKTVRCTLCWWWWATEEEARRANSTPAAVNIQPTGLHGHVLVGAAACALTQRKYSTHACHARQSKTHWRPLPDTTS